MDKITESVKSVQNESSGFLNYVFNFDNENKSRIMNMVQYTLLTIIPVLLILRGIKHIIPEEDESKGSLEIIAESVGQIFLIMMGIWFINKIIRYIPTYSGENYHKFNNINFILPFVIILATMQTKFGLKMNILIERASDLWYGKNRENFQAQQQQGQQQQQGAVRVSQPFAGQQNQPSQADYLDRTQLLPSNPSMSAMPPQRSPDFNSMNQNQPTPLVNPVFPAQSNEPMAANEGYGAFSAW